MSCSKRWQLCYSLINESVSKWILSKNVHQTFEPKFVQYEFVHLAVGNHYIMPILWIRRGGGVQSSSWRWLARTYSLQSRHLLTACPILWKSTFHSLIQRMVIQRFPLFVTPSLVCEVDVDPARCFQFRSLIFFIWISCCIHENCIRICMSEKWIILVHWDEKILCSLDAKQMRSFSKRQYRKKNRSKTSSWNFLSVIGWKKTKNDEDEIIIFKAYRICWLSNALWSSPTAWYDLSSSRTLSLALSLSLSLSLCLSLCTVVAMYWESARHIAEAGDGGN